MARKTFAALLIGVLVLLAVSARTATYSTRYASGTTQAVVMDRGLIGFIPLIVGYEVKSDLASSVLKFFTGGAATTSSAGASGQATAAVASTANFLAVVPGEGDYVMIQYGATATKNQWNRISSITDGVSLSFVDSLAFAITNGDKIYRMDQIAQKEVGDSTVSLYSNALGILGGTKSMPIAATIDGTSECSINLFSLVYVK